MKLNVFIWSQPVPASLHGPELNKDKHQHLGRMEQGDASWAVSLGGPKHLRPLPHTLPCAAPHIRVA